MTEAGAQSTLLRDVSLLTQSTTGPVAVPGLTLAFDDAGVAILRSSGTMAASLPWSSVTALLVVERAQSPDGRQALVIDIVGADAPHRFLIPCSDLASTEQLVTGWALGRVAGQYSAIPVAADAAVAADAVTPSSLRRTLPPSFVLTVVATIAVLSLLVYLFFAFFV